MSFKEKANKRFVSHSLDCVFKVHLTPKFFFRLKKSSCFGDYFFKNIFGFCQILEFLCPVEVEFRMDHDRVNGDLGRVEL